MSTGKKYRTKQRKEVMNFLKSIPGTHITAEEVFKQLKAQGSSIGKTTVYRQLGNLVDEGLVNKYFVDENSPVCFEYVDKDSSQNTESSFHCKCTGCGKLIHLQCNELEGIQGHLMEQHHFKLDPSRTVFYGYCENCIKKTKLKG